MKTGSRPVPRWKLFAILLGALVVPVLSLWLWTERVAARKWAAMEKSVQEWISEAKARDARRPVLQGDGVPGNAWEDYEIALQDVRKARWGGTVGDFVMRRPGANRFPVEAILAAHGPALEHWNRGLRRAEAQYPHDWAAVDSRDLTGENNLGMLVACKARCLLQDESLTEAADLLLGLGLFARDVGHNGFSAHKDLAMTLYGLAVDGLKEVILSKPLAKFELERIARGLEILDRSYEREGFNYLNARTWIGLAFLRLGPMADVLPPHQAKASWRFAFSTKLMAVNTFETVGQWYARSAACQSMSWSDELKITQEIEAESKASSNPMIHDFYSRGWSDLRYRLAQLRLLRMAAHSLITGESLHLDDPFGTTLFHSKVGDSLRVWSVSSDGVSDSGKGRWEGLGFPPGPHYPEDIILKVLP